MTHRPTKFHYNPFIAFLGILLTDGQTDRRTNRGEKITSSNFAGGGKNLDIQQFSMCALQNILLIEAEYMLKASRPPVILS